MKSLYFSHDYNANSDPKILKLLVKYGYEGYGIYWRILEYLYSQDGYLEDYNDVITMLFPSYNNVITILEYMINLQLFEIDEKYRLYSKRLLDTINLQFSKAKKYSKAGKLGMKSRYSNPNDVITTLQRCNNDDITKEIKKNRKEIKEKEKEKEKVSGETPLAKKSKIFEKPTMDDICEYFITNCKLSISVAEVETEKFFNHYEANGWFVGKNKMKNWHAAASGWLLRAQQYGK